MAAQNSPSTEPDDPSKRRTLKRIGVGASTVATLGGSSAIAPRFSPIGRARAIAPLAGYLAVSAVAGLSFGAGLAWMAPDQKEVDMDDILEDQLYEAALSVRDGRDPFLSQMQNEFLGADNPQNTPFGRSAWQNIRAAVVRSNVNGKSLSEAEISATDALDKQAVRSVVNLTERWNTGINALVQQLTIDQQESVGVFALPDTSDSISPVPSSSGNVENYTPVEASNVSSDEHVVYKQTIDQSNTNIPVNPQDLEGRDEPLVQYYLAVDKGNGNQAVAPLSGQLGWRSTSYEPGSNLSATHPDLQNREVLGLQDLYQIIQVVADAYDAIQNSLSDYVSNLYAGLNQGAIDPDDILSSQDIIDEFADSSAQSRLAAELIAVGAQVPEGSSYRATISHPDLETDELNCLVFPQFAEGASVTSLSPGVTLQPADYNMAYIGYQSSTNDEFVTEILSGESALEVHDLEGVEGQESIDSSNTGGTAGTDGRVVLTTDEPPDQLSNPGEYEDWKIVVSGANNRHVAPVADAVEDGDQWVLETTSLSADESIESIEIVPSVEYSRSIDYVADPTTVDSEQTLERMENLRQQVDDLESALEDDSGGPLFGGGGLFSGGNFGGGSFVGLAIIGVVVLAVVGFVTDMIPGLGN